MNPWRRALLRACLASCLLPMAACGNNDKPRFHNIDISGASYGRDFELLDPDGNIRRLSDFRGKVVMLFFGFVQCPDVCPTALQRASAVRRLLEADGERLQIIFITLDPERDLPIVLREYSAAFDADVLGLYGTLKKTHETADAFRIHFRKVSVGGGYTIDHTATSYIYDPEGRLRLAVPFQGTAKSIAADVALLLHPSSTTNNKEPR
ncbi:MAG: SCO family protein [Betaproteobacteria bacterium]|nr:SCO family protein [Betaproteobacteria bacterium]